MSHVFSWVVTLFLMNMFCFSKKPHDRPLIVKHVSGIHIVFFFSKSSTRQEGQMINLPWQILVMCSVEKNCNRAAWKWKVYFFVIFLWPISQYLHCSTSCLYLQPLTDTENPGASENEVPLWLPWRLERVLLLFLIMFCFFFKLLSLLLDIISWSK